MDYEALLELSVDLAYEIQCCGAETYRVEDVVTHLLGAYGIESEVFAIPNSIFVSIETPDGVHLNRMRRSRGSSNNLEGLERYNALCRRLCREKPPVEEGRRLLNETKAQLHQQKLWLFMLAHVMTGWGFVYLFGGTHVDALVGGLCGLVICLCNRFANSLHANVFFQTVFSGFVLAFTAHCLFHLGIGTCLDAAICGPLMLLVPGLLFTNSIRDVIYGDSLSGVNRLVQVVIIAIALAVGSGAGAAAARMVFDSAAVSGDATRYSLLVECVTCAIASCGVCYFFNVRGPGTVLCLLGGSLTWCCCRLCMAIGMSEPIAFLVSSSVIAVYAETMARIRRCPSTGYLIVGLIPLIPGAALYRAMVFAVGGDMDAFMSQGAYTAALAGALAVGVLLVSTVFRMGTVWHLRRKQTGLGKKQG